jgi:hypothetical protein
MVSKEPHFYRFSCWSVHPAPALHNSHKTRQPLTFPTESFRILVPGLSGESFDFTLRFKNAFDEDAPDFAQIFQSDLNSFRPVASIVGIPRRRIGLTARFRF